MFSPKFDNLVKQLKVLPSVGQKTAQRMALNLLTHKRSQGIQLAEALLIAMNEIKQCKQCRGLSDDDVCPICSNPHRDENQLCIVENASDMMAIEQTASFQGQYFVLGGVLSPIDGIGAEQLGIDQLIQRLYNQAQQNNPINEIILATSTTDKGQTTAYFISEAIKPYVQNITRIAQGVPMSGEIEYLDSITLGQALQNRTRL
ncbi:recombination protein RecR [Moraxella macacae 0408225]|uniref:Recombination protein RecR n=1 Tax=Moraxella macacae 0408225 TaxID=1230338 RepID=L2F4Z9_9GAMM|nr:recombination mediator RecR [Moraxella macacae]ELA07985.1 recombination protein RecR [Moraxella macacae 0408225]